MARDICPRCGKTLHTTTTPPGEHLCADKAARLRRREAQVAAVEAILHDPQGVRGLTMRQKAEAIVERLARMGVTED